MIFQTIAEVTKVETLIKGLKLVFHTNELPPDEMAKIFSFYDKQGWLLFKGNAAIQPDEVKDLPEVKLDYGEKSPGQRLRACLFHYWRQTGGVKRLDGKTFEQYYREYMERLINAIKEKLT